MDLKNLKKKIRKPNVFRLMPNVRNFQTENHTPGYGIYRKSISQEMDFYSL
jgi:hypothetical protein